VTKAFDVIEEITIEFYPGWASILEVLKLMPVLNPHKLLS
jgi:hypothetical protein